MATYSFPSLGVFYPGGGALPLLAAINTVNQTTTEATLTIIATSSTEESVAYANNLDQSVKHWRYSAVGTVS